MSEQWRRRRKVSPCAARTICTQEQRHGTSWVETNVQRGMCWSVWLERQEGAYYVGPCMTL